MIGRGAWESVCLLACQLIPISRFGNCWENHILVRTTRSTQFGTSQLSNWSFRFLPAKWEQQYLLCSIIKRLTEVLMQSTYSPKRLFPFILKTLETTWKPLSRSLASTCSANLTNGCPAFSTPPVTKDHIYYLQKQSIPFSDSLIISSSSLCRTEICLVTEQI